MALSFRIVELPRQQVLLSKLLLLTPNHLLVVLLLTGGSMMIPKLKRLGSKKCLNAIRKNTRSRRRNLSDNVNSLHLVPTIIAEE